MVASLGLVRGDLAVPLNQIEATASQFANKTLRYQAKRCLELTAAAVARQAIKTYFTSG
jgi:hypothetical protein